MAERPACGFQVPDSKNSMDLRFLQESIRNPLHAVGLKDKINNTHYRKNNKKNNKTSRNNTYEIAYKRTA